MREIVLPSVQWTSVAIAMGIFAAIAVVVTLCILLVTKLCKADTDEKAERVLSRLAGINCGGCGFEGCSGFANGLCKGEANLSDCHVTPDGDKLKIADELGVRYTSARPTVSVCHCLGGENATDEFDYFGAEDCAEQAKLFGGKKACKYGCLGNGNCVHACPVDAVTLPHVCADVNPDRCVSCGACIRVCPKNLFSRIPADALVYVGCSSHERGKAVLNVCKRGCIACGKCENICPSHAIAMRDNLPVIDYEKCIKCGKCEKVCPRNTIVKRY